ncbi:hypothetical protein K503DRAFT_564109 [Rhizopogon vinicolor AM-OR11-026]|uniref:Uncharacterized protein n=1 Tax=Rhizopogon vinicolor AM-OR11-026 TaxID=1314800 RepID=A0A1B7N7S3_9AGAM|nr:hypothetical protein K503DRAFT_564109 [Rhizopogon vinicolor AM-OR11-026]
MPPDILKHLLYGSIQHVLIPENNSRVELCSQLLEASWGHWLLPLFWHTFSEHIMGDGGGMSRDKRFDMAIPLDLSTVQAMLVTSPCDSSLISCTSAS